MLIINVLLCLIFVGWLALTIGVQFKPKYPLFSKINGYGLSFLNPQWKLFAPNPISRDFHLLYRDLYRDGTTGPLQEVKFDDDPFLLLRIIWTPKQRERKVILTLCNAITRLKKAKKSDREIFNSSSFRILFQYVKNLPVEENVNMRQFIIVSSYIKRLKTETTQHVIAHIKYKNHKLNQHRKLKPASNG